MSLPRLSTVQSADSHRTTVVAVNALMRQTETLSAAATRPEDFGAIGDGTTNDTVAFQKLAAAINAAGGGVIDLKPSATYAVGLQALANDGTWMFKGEDILYLTGCSRGIVIRGNGAKIKFADNLKFGTFDSSGSPTTHSLPYSGGDASAPIGDSAGIISLQSNSGPISIDNLELDGNVPGLDIGGPFGDSGYQLPGDGLILFHNTGGVKIDNVYVHDFPRDGSQVSAVATVGDTGDDVARYPHTFTNCNFDLNSRNNVSYLGGRGGLFRNTKFTNAAKGSLVSSPASNFDLETEHGSARDVAFEDCLFSNGFNTSFVTDNQDVDGLSFKRCHFDGPTNWAAWIEAVAGLVMEECRIFGAMIYSDPSDLGKAARFIRCKWSDKDGSSPSGLNLSFLSASGFSGAGGGLHGNNAYFDHCRWDMHHIPPFGATGSIHQDSTVVCATGISIGVYTDNIFRGKSDITGDTGNLNDNAPGRKIVGTYYLNGTQQMAGSTTFDTPSLSDGDHAQVSIAAPGALVGQAAIAQLGTALQGAMMWAEVPLNDIISVRIHNASGSTIDIPSATLTARAFDVDAA